MRVSKPLLPAGMILLTFVLFSSRAAKAQEKEGEKKPTEKQPVGKPEGKATAKPKPNLKRIRVYLMDGSVIAGELSVDQVEVQTEFGTLTIPISKIQSITPGLDSHTKLKDRIDKLIKALGGQDYKAREQAQKDLMAMGPPVREIVAEYTDDKNAELKRRATEIVGKLDEASGHDDFDEDTGASRAWVRHDTVVTATFTIVGRISPSAFQVKTKFGPLKLSLNDIKRTENEFTTKVAVVKRLSVAGQKLIQRGMQTSRLHVKAGDIVTVSATGRIVMTPFGSTKTSGPDGSSTYSYYYATVNGVRTKLYGGSLVARIGSSGQQFIKIGSRAKFKVKRSGVLYFGVAMNNSYISTSYFYAGEYKLRIKVEPKK